MASISTSETTTANSLPARPLARHRFNHAQKFDQVLFWELPNGGQTTTCDASFAAGATQWISTYGGGTLTGQNPPLSPDLITGGSP